MEGILLIDKPKDKTSFYLVSFLRKLTDIQKIGHAGTLDPLATGVMVMLLGKKFTRLCTQFVHHDKEYQVRMLLGKKTDTFDITGQILDENDTVPSLEDIMKILPQFQGNYEQIPPMFSAKKYKGKKLYELARMGQTIERKPTTVTITTKLIAYNYPFLDLHIECSSGTYIRTLVNDMGNLLSIGATVYTLTRLRSGPFLLKDCISINQLNVQNFDYTQHLQTV